MRGALQLRDYTLLKITQVPSQPFPDADSLVRGSHIIEATVGAWLMAVLALIMALHFTVYAGRIVSETLRPYVWFLVNFYFLCLLVRRMFRSPQLRRRVIRRLRSAAKKKSRDW